MAFPLFHQALTRNDTLSSRASHAPNSHGDSAGILTQQNVNALSAQAEHGLTPEGAKSLSRGRLPTSLVDRTRLPGAGDAGDYGVWRKNFGAGL